MNDTDVIALTIDVSEFDWLDSDEYLQKIAKLAGETVLRRLNEIACEKTGHRFWTDHPLCARCLHPRETEVTSG